MTIIDKKAIDDLFELQIHDSPIDSSRSRERNAWISHEEPFFDREIYQFWLIYNKPLSGTPDIYFQSGDEINERKRYIKNPILTNIKKKENIAVGGIWVDDIINKNKTKTARFHISVIPEYRKTAYPLMEYFMQTFNDQYNKKGKYSDLVCSWGRREPKDDPNNFFKNLGFIVKKEREGGSAYFPLSKL
jgi:hypothetical protein